MINKFNKVLLVDADLIKSLSVINSNVADEFISIAIRDTQFVDLQSLIGTRLLNRLMELIYNDAKGLEDTINDANNVAYKDLLDNLIMPFLVHRTAVNTLIPVSYKVRNMGVVKTSGNNTANADFLDIQYLIKYYSTQADFYKSKISKFLCVYREAFKELDEEIEAWENAPMLGKDFAESELWLGGSSNKNNCGC